MPGVSVISDVMAESSLNLVAGLVVTLLLLVVPLVICAMKGKYGLAVSGIFFGVVAWVGAIRLAMPESYWARHFYSEAKREKARERFPAEAQRLNRYRERGPSGA